MRNVTLLGEFCFVYPPHVTHHFRRLASQEITLIGSVPSFEQLGKLRHVCDKDGPLPFTDDNVSAEVLVKGFHSKGLDYEVLLLEYTPIQMLVRNVQTGQYEEIGRSMLRPRFQLQFVSSQSGQKKVIKFGSPGFSKSSTMIVKPDKFASGRFFFEDYSSEAKLGIGVRVGDTVEILLGYERALENAYTGEVTNADEVAAGRLEFYFESDRPIPQVQTQKFVYFLTAGTNIMSIRVKEGVSGISRYVKTTGLPSLRPSYELTVHHPRLRGRYTYSAGEVVHEWSAEVGFITSAELL